MTLTVPNWDVSRCVLWGIESNDSILGPVIHLPPLDYVVGDILSLNFDETQNNRIQPIRDHAWLDLIRNNADYLNIARSALDFEDESDDKKISNTVFACLDRFFELTIKQPQYMTLNNFEIFLAMCQIPILAPECRLVNKGFWTGERESSEDILAFEEVVDSFNNDRGKGFFDTLEKNKHSVDLHCNYRIDGFSDLALIGTYLVLKAGKTFAQCEHCNRLFSPSRKGEIYCSRIAPGGNQQTCKEAAKYEKQLKRERASESGRIYKSVNTMLAAKVNYAKNEKEILSRERELSDFRLKAKEWRRLIQRGEKAEDEYIAFLNSYKKRTPK